MVRVTGMNLNIIVEKSEILAKRYNYKHLVLIGYLRSAMGINFPLPHSQ